MRKSSRPLEPRLLTQAEAASYCGLCVSTFRKACRIPPIRLLDRIPRYDRHDLDRWLDTLSTYRMAKATTDLEALWDAGNGRAGKGN